MDELGSILRARSLAPHQRVLALTFMHGSRRRLDSRLRSIAELAGRFEATVIDRFAWRLVQRWRRLAKHLGTAIPLEGDFNATCAVAASLLERAVVQAWVAMSFPVVLVDEAQDLSYERSAMIKACAPSVNILLAFDEFQCLNPALLPISVETWLRDYCEPTILAGCHRTNDNELINAAHALRDGRALAIEGQRFKAMATPGHPNFAATCLANAIKWRRGGGNVAVLTPSRTGGFAERAVRRVGEGPVGSLGNGPYEIVWEGTDRQELSELWQKLAIQEGCSVAAALDRLAAHRAQPSANSLREWLIRRRSASGLRTVDAAALERQLERTLAARRHYAVRAERQFTAMTIQQAKNREFDHVVVLWPYRMRDDPVQKRRLLYNAVTRAKRSCTVLVQSADMLQAAPFVPHS